MRRYLVTNHEKGINYDCILKRYPNGPFYIGKDVTGKGNRIHYRKETIEKQSKFTVEEKH